MVDWTDDYFKLLEQVEYKTAKIAQVHNVKG